jgi:hypothetical protein
MKIDADGFYLCDCGHKLIITDVEGNAAYCPECNKKYLFPSGCFGMFIVMFIVGAMSIEVIRILVS